MSNKGDELARVEQLIADFRRRIAEQQLRTKDEGGEALRSAEVLGLMLRSLECWEQRKRALECEINRQRGEKAPPIVLAGPLPRKGERR
jgi:hypothetical protein